MVSLPRAFDWHAAPRAERAPSAAAFQEGALRRQNRRTISVGNGMWQWQEGFSWKPFNNAHQSTLERAFGNPSTSSIQLSLGSAQYHIDFSGMVQTNVATGTQRAIQRLANCPLAGAMWEWQDGNAPLGWVPFGAHAEEHLEAVRNVGRQHTTLMIAGKVYEVNLITMRQTNAQTGFPRAIRRQQLAVAGSTGHSAPFPGLPLPVVAPARAMPPPNARQQAVPPMLTSAAAGPAQNRAKRPRHGIRGVRGADDGDGEGRVDVVHFECHDGAIEFATVTDWRFLKAFEEYEPGDDCPITACPFGEDAGDPVVKLSCGCIFNRSTVERALTNKPQCPLCQFKFTMPGAMPSGTMRVSHDSHPCEGNESFGTIVIEYSFRSGVQGPQHPSPGAAYHGTERVCYLPHNKPGERTLRLLKEAFKRGLTFKVGTSVTTGRSNCVTWALHHKTSRSGGAQNYGWPDEGYFERIASECAALGLLLDDEAAPAAAPGTG